MINNKIVADPLSLALDYSYNLNVMKDVKVTDSFLTLDENVIECQNDTTFENCVTQNYLEGYIKKCNCLPIQVRLSTEV